MENKIIEFENKHIRILSNDNWTTVWFVAQDLEQITDHKHIVNTINKVLDQDEYDTVVQQRNSSLKISLKILKSITENMTIIIHNGKNLANIDYKWVERSEAMAIVIKAMKEGKAKKLIDTDETLMYKINN